MTHDRDHEDQDFERRARESEPAECRAPAAYDFIICGAGSSGSVVARRLAENPGMKVLLIEAGGSDDAEQVLDSGQWPLNLGSERDWGYVAKPNPHLNDRALAMSMGKALGGGSSVNVMVYPPVAAFL